MSCARIALMVLAGLSLAAPAGAVNHGLVLARAICTGQGKAVETLIATERPDLNAGIEISPQKTLRPLSLVLTCLQSRQRKALGEHPETEAVMLERLLRLDAEATYQEPDLKRSTPLHLALGLPLEQQQELINLLLRFDGERNLGLRDQDDQTPADLAAKTNPGLAGSLARYVPSGLSDMNIRLQPFTYSAGLKDLELFRQQEALLEALAEGDLKAAKALLSSGLSPDFALIEPPGRPLLHHLALNAGDPDVLAQLELVLMHRPNLRQRDLEQQEVLHVLAKAGVTAPMKLLLQKGASLTARDAQGETPLFAAVRGGESSAAARLLELGADAERTNHQGQTPLSLALELEKTNPIIYRGVRELLQGL